MIKTGIITQILISSVAISCLGQKKPPVSIKEILSIGGKGEFIRIEEVASDPTGNIYITDAYRYTIRKFSPAGILTGEYGKRGNNPEHFLTAPYKIICNDKTIAVATKGSACIQLFTENFIFKNKIFLPGAVTDMTFDDNGRIVACILPYNHNEHRILFLVDKSGKILAEAFTENKDAEPAFSLTHIAAGKSNSIIVACRFTNMIAIYSNELKLIKTFSVPDLPAEAPSSRGTIKDIGKIPEGDLIKDIAADNYGNIYVLTGDYDSNPNREVYTFDPVGIYLGHFQLPAKSGIIYIDDGNNLYTRENQRTILKKYNLRHRLNKPGEP